MIELSSFYPRPSHGRTGRVRFVTGSLWRPI